MDGGVYNHHLREMEDWSKMTYRRIERNDDTLTELGLCNISNSNVSRDGRIFTSRDGDDYSRLGSCIGRNTHLQTLYVELQSFTLSVSDSGFFEGIEQNSSIRKFRLSGYPRNPGIAADGLLNLEAGVVGCELLKAFRKNNNLTSLHIWSCDISNAEENITTMLRSCTNLINISLPFCDVTDEQLLPLVEAIRGHSSLKTLRLRDNNIGNVGCEALAALLEDLKCNIQTLNLSNNQIGNEGAIAIANSLANNNKLKNLDISKNQMGNQKIVKDAFSNVLCNTTSINDIYSSNHVFRGFKQDQPKGRSLLTLLKLNKDTNKSCVAMKKIASYHPEVLADMEPFYEWDENGEQSLKSLPYIIAWFERLAVAVADVHCSFSIDIRRLSAIYQFARDMPLMFEPISRMEVDNLSNGGESKAEGIKRKRDDM